MQPPENPLTSNEELGPHVKVKKSKLHGLGTFAARNIRKGEYIGTYWGYGTKVVSPHTLIITDDNGNKRHIEGRNLLRYINHSGNPNAYFKNAHLYALEDIRSGEELTFDYTNEGDPDPFGKVGS